MSKNLSINATNLAVSCASCSPVSTNALLTDSLRTCWTIIDVSTTGQVHQHYFKIKPGQQGQLASWQRKTGWCAQTSTWEPWQDLLPSPYPARKVPPNVAMKCGFHHSVELQYDRLNITHSYNVHVHTYPECSTVWSPAVSGSLDEMGGSERKNKYLPSDAWMLRTQ